MKKNLIKVRDGRRTLYYRPIAGRTDGVCAELVAYRRDDVTHWY